MAKTVAQALTLADHEDLCCALLDVRLKDGHVFPAAERLEERGVPFAFHTGNADLAILSERWPNVQVLSKPSPLSAIVDAIHAVARIPR